MDSPRIIRIALGQFEVQQGDPVANLTIIRSLAARARAQGADLLCLPELCYPGYFLSVEDTRRLAQPSDGFFARALSACAKEHHLMMLAGYAELEEKAGADSIYNACLLMGADGILIGNVRKVYLWGKEKEKFSPGDRFPLFDTPLGKIGILNCYDAEYPEPARILALKGAQLLLVPAAWSIGAARRWEVELAANALFNLLFVAGVNQVNRYCCGASRLIGPDGEIRATASPDQEELLICEADLTEIAQTRERIPYFSDFRPDTFSIDALKRY